jgi:hypothetical protein
LGTVESWRRYRGSMARITPIGDVLAPRPMVRPVASIMAAVAVASAVAAWVGYIGLLPSDLELPKDQVSSDLELPKDQAPLFDARFPTQSELPSPSAVDTKFQVAKGLLAQKLRDGDRNTSEPEESPTTIAVAVPVPRARPALANLGPPRSEVAQTDDRTLLQRLSDLFRPRVTLASMTPEDGISSEVPDLASRGYDGLTAVYDISARTVYLPNGLRLEAHSGFGSTKDDPRYVSQRGVGATPPAVYDLKLRERPFHGVRALRMIPVEGDTLGRSGLLAHGYMLGPNGDSNGCVSIRDYERFLAAFERGEIRRLVVISNVADLARQPLKS